MTAPHPSIFDAAGGMPTMLALAHAWHERCLADPIVSHAFSHGFHPKHTERLAAYWAEALGGPTTFSTQYGTEASVVRRHSGNGEHDEMDRRAEACFVMALDDINVTDTALRETLTGYFQWANSAMARYPGSANDVPKTLPFPFWSWDGPVTR